jgi:hypothetical protein
MDKLQKNFEGATQVKMPESGAAEDMSGDQANFVVLHQLLDSTSVVLLRGDGIKHLFSKLVTDVWVHLTAGHPSDVPEYSTVIKSHELIFSLRAKFFTRKPALRAEQPNSHA